MYTCSVALQLVLNKLICEESSHNLYVCVYSKFQSCKYSVKRFILGRGGLQFRFIIYILSILVIMCTSPCVHRVALQFMEMQPKGERMSETSQLDISCLAKVVTSYSVSMVSGARGHAHKHGTPAPRCAQVHGDKLDWTLCDGPGVAPVSKM